MINDKIEVVWPDGRKQEIMQPIVNQKLVIDKTKSIVTNSLTSENSESLFKNIIPAGLDFTHQENEYDDFVKELLLPHKKFSAWAFFKCS